MLWPCFPEWFSLVPKVAWSGSQTYLSIKLRIPADLFDLLWSGFLQWFDQVPQSGLVMFPRVVFSRSLECFDQVSQTWVLWSAGFLEWFSRVPRVAWSGLVGFPGAHFPESDSANARFMQIKPICSASKRRLTMQCTTMWCDGERIDCRASFGSYDLWSAPKLE